MMPCIHPTYHACLHPKGRNHEPCLHCDLCGSAPAKGEAVVRSDLELSKDDKMDADHRRRCDALRLAYAELYEAYGESDELDALGDALDTYFNEMGYEDLDGKLSDVPHADCGTLRRFGTNEAMRAATPAELREARAAIDAGVRLDMD